MPNMVLVLNYQTACQNVIASLSALQAADRAARQEVHDTKGAALLDLNAELPQQTPFIVERLNSILAQLARLGY